MDSISQFIWQEADLLDHKRYREWLDLWDVDGKYVVPIDPDATDFEDCLNYAYDNAAMRDMRVRRLTSGQSMSAAHAAQTLRTISRFVRLEDDRNGHICVRAAQNLVEYKFGKHRIYAANVTWRLKTDGDGFKIYEKVARLLNSEDALSGMTILL
ncbi:MAG: aromatic-ring-hydroxylating dioxygenase subunit beta [Erythrobacter sp.]